MTNGGEIKTFHSLASLSRAKYHIVLHVLVCYLQVSWWGAIFSRFGDRLIKKRATGAGDRVGDGGGAPCQDLGAGLCICICICISIVFVFCQGLSAGPLPPLPHHKHCHQAEENHMLVILSPHSSRDHILAILWSFAEGWSGTGTSPSSLQTLTEVQGRLSKTHKDLGANQCQCLERQKFYEEVARILEGHFLDFLNGLSLVQIKVSLWGLILYHFISPLFSHLFWFLSLNSSAS